jgi:hypothetical protein
VTIDVLSLLFQLTHQYICTFYVGFIPARAHLTLSAPYLRCCYLVFSSFSLRLSFKWLTITPSFILPASGTLSTSLTVLLRLKFPRRFDELPMISQLGTNGDRGDTDLVQKSYNLSPSSSSTTSTNLSPPSLIAFTDVLDASTRSQPLPDSPDLANSSSNQLRKPRKEKQQIELAPDQPPTTQGRPRTRVFVACVQWCGPFSLSMSSSTL